MQTRLLFALLLAMVAATTARAEDYVVVNSTCFGAAPLQPPATTVLAQRTYRVMGSDSANVVVRRKACSDGSTALYATFTGFDPFFGLPVLTALIQNGASYVPSLARDPLGCNHLDACGGPIPYFSQTQGLPQTTVLTSASSSFETGPAFDDEQAFTLSLSGGYPIETTSHAIPASGSAGSSLPPSRTLSDNMTGTWWNPIRGGEGFTFDIGTFGSRRYLFFTWYTYVDQRGVFLSGSAELPAPTSSVQVPVYQTRGAQFGSQFVPSQVVTAAVGSVGIERLACDQVRLSYTGSLGAFATQTISPLWTHDFGTTCQ